ncbi:MAG: hypothetical protein ACYC4A_06140 [Desulfobulbia bacterium]
MINKEKLGTYLWPAPFYLLTVGVLYLWGYWESFGVNIFEFVALSDVVKVAIIPVGSVFLFVLLGFGIGEITIADKFNEGGGRSTKIGKILNKLFPFFVVIYLVIITYLMFSKPELPGKWKVLPVFLMFPPYFLLKGSGFIKEIHNDSLRSLIIISIVALPLYSFSTGKINAEKILKNNEYKFIELGENTAKEKMKFIGHANNYLFFISMDNGKIMITNIDKHGPLTLHVSTQKN